MVRRSDVTYSVVATAFPIPLLNYLWSTQCSPTLGHETNDAGGDLLVILWCLALDGDSLVMSRHMGYIRDIALVPWHNLCIYTYIHTKCTSMYVSSSERPIRGRKSFNSSCCHENSLACCAAFSNWYFACALMTLDYVYMFTVSFGLSVICYNCAYCS